MQSLAVRRDVNGVVQVEMSKPRIDEVMVDELAAAFETLGEDPGARVVVLSAQGDSFSTGADLRRVMRTNPPRSEWSVADSRAFARMLWLIDSCAKPTIARVHGVAAGGGIGLVCACDFVVASDEASFAVAEAGLGAAPPVIRPHLVKAVGKEQAQCLALSGMRIDAEQALTIGLVQAVVPKSELDATTKALGSILRNSPNASGKLKSTFPRGLR